MLVNDITQLEFTILNPVRIRSCNSLHGNDFKLPLSMVKLPLSMVRYLLKF